MTMTMTITMTMTMMMKIIIIIIITTTIIIIIIIVIIIIIKVFASRGKIPDLNFKINSEKSLMSLESAGLRSLLVLLVRKQNH